jgi:aromatic-L-amino-acid decarboxylase
MSLHLQALAVAYRHAVDHLDGLDSRPVAATASVDQLRERLGIALPRSGTPADVVIDEMVAAASGGHLGSASGRFFAWVIGGALPSALAADWLASTWDNNAALYACGPAAAVVEEVAGDWLKDILGLPREASFAFTTGCQLAHMTCLAAARHAVLANAGWGVEADGLFGAPRIRVICSTERHGSIERTLRFLGLGSNALEPIVTGDDGRISPASLDAALRSKTRPTIVVLNAADLNIGAFDPFVELIPIARNAGAWVHVDGAFGLWARASPERRHLAAGIELADSWATDAHKWLNTPQDSGLAFVRDAQAHRAAMTLSASYLTSSDDARDEIDWTPDWTRRARGFAVYAALRELGREGVANLIERCCAHATSLAYGISALPNAQLLVAPTLNQGLVRFLDPNSSSEADHDCRTDAIIESINNTGEAFFSGTDWNGRRAMRISVCNWRTNAHDVERTIRAIGSVLKSQDVDRRA